MILLSSTYVHVNKRTHIQTHTVLQVHKNTLTSGHIQTHTYTHTHAHTHTHTHTHTQVLADVGKVREQAIKAFQQEQASNSDEDENNNNNNHNSLKRCGRDLRRAFVACTGQLILLCKDSKLVDRTLLDCLRDCAWEVRQEVVQVCEGVCERERESAGSCMALCLYVCMFVLEWDVRRCNTYTHITQYARTHKSNNT